MDLGIRARAQDGDRRERPAGPRACGAVRTSPPGIESNSPSRRPASSIAQPSLSRFQFDSQLQEHSKLFRKNVRSVSAMLSNGKRNVVVVDDDEFMRQYL